mmetsp:Transcript_4222/g.5937  ORF Transcript_4222/g.5937 Transcript_4222/m.5937 type:complete len:439 (+) Transcript_4222:42-1358(+)
MHMRSGRRCHYHSHHQSERGEGNMNMIYVPQPQPQPAAAAEARDTESFSFGDDVPPAAAATSPDPDPESNTALTMAATKKRRMSDNSAQSHLYPYQMQMQMQMQESSFSQGWNEERSSAFASMPNTHKDKEEASSTDKEADKKPGPYPQKGGDPNPNPINDTIIRNNPHPYLHPHFQVLSPSFSPAHEQFHHFHSPQNHEHPDNNLLPLAAPYSPVRRQFGNEHYMSPGPGRPAPAAAAHSKKDPPPSAVATEEAKMKANSDGGEDSADLPPPLPFLPVKGICTSTSSQRNAWDRKFNELLEFKQQHGHCDVPQTYAQNPKLGVWVNKQRMEHKNREDGNISTLTDERLERLQGIGFRWAKRRGQVRWDEKYAELIQYAAKFGNCHVPTKYKENTALGRWVSTQRAEYKKYCKGEKSSLTAEKIQRLDSIGFAWFMAL